MDRISPFAVILATLLFTGFEPWICRAQPAQPAPRPAIPPPRPFGQPGPSVAPQPLQVSPLAGAAADLDVTLKPVPLEPTDFGLPLNLATALQLSDARPLNVAAAQTDVWIAEAQLTRAKVLLIPTMIFGADYVRHDGGGPDFNKGVMTAPSVNYFYAGGGLNISNSGLFQFINLTDVFFEPRVAQRILDSRQADIQTAKNDALFMTADVYFRVHQYRGLYAGALYCVERGHELVDQIASLSDELVSRVEVDRACNLLADLEQQSGLHEGGASRYLALEPAPRAPRRGIYERNRSARGLPEQSVINTDPVFNDDLVPGVCRHRCYS